MQQKLDEVQHGMPFPRVLVGLQNQARYAHLDPAAEQRGEQQGAKRARARKPPTPAGQLTANGTSGPMPPMATAALFPRLAQDVVSAMETGDMSLVSAALRCLAEKLRGYAEDLERAASDPAVFFGKAGKPLLLELRDARLERPLDGSGVDGKALPHPAACSDNMWFVQTWGPLTRKPDSAWAVQFVSVPGVPGAFQGQNGVFADEPCGEIERADGRLALKTSARRAALAATEAFALADDVAMKRQAKIRRTARGAKREEKNAAVVRRPPPLHETANRHMNEGLERDHAQQQKLQRQFFREHKETIAPFVDTSQLNAYLRQAGTAPFPKERPL
jgi:hypothetical protein